jgi:hypothetical protein
MLMGPSFGSLYAGLPGTNALPSPDPCDGPVILLGADSPMALETRAALQSLGFEVLYGPDLVNADDQPFLVVMRDCLQQPQYRQRLDRLRTGLALAPVFFVSCPADAVLQLTPRHS